VTPGHEWSGEVVETGKAVAGLKRGDRVVGKCVIESGEKVDHFGFSIDGAYSQLFKARPEWLHRHRALDLWWSMIFSENRYPLFRIMP
jgi:L-iditol 2-dehydrogenase